jgi:hypothetical protein
VAICVHPKDATKSLVVSTLKERGLDAGAEQRPLRPRGPDLRLQGAHDGGNTPEVLDIETIDRVRKPKQ